MIFSCNLKHANENHLKYMTEKGVNDEAVEKFRASFLCTLPFEWKVYGIRHCQMELGFFLLTLKLSAEPEFVASIYGSQDKYCTL